MWKGTLVVGELSVPVSLTVAASRERSGFSFLHVACGRPISQRRRCQHCNVELPTNADVVRAYEVATGQWVQFDTGELESALKADTIKLDHFIASSDVPGHYRDRSYWVVPASDVYSEAAYAALLRGMRQEGLAGLGKLVVSTSESPVLVEVSGEDVLSATSLFYPDQVRKPDFWKRIGGVQLPEELVGLAAEAVAARRPLRYPMSRLAKTFPQELQAVVAKKVAGGKVRVPETQAAAPRDLEETLRRSVRKAKRKAKGDGAGARGG